MILWLLLFFSLQKEVRCQYVTSETSLRAAILTGYDTDIRPYATTSVTTILGLMSLNTLDMGEQKMSLTAFWFTSWNDSRLGWNPASYGGITQLVINQDKIWKPPLIVKNEMNKIGMVSKAVVPLRIINSGYVIWVAPITMNTICEVNVQRYPFDDQECLVELSTWGYAMNEVNLIVPNDPQLDTRLYVQSGEWIYVSFSVILNNITDDMNTYRTVQFKLKFERRWLFYSQYLLLPIMMNSVLMISVFLVPLDSGEKLGFSLTVLLSYVVLLTIVTDNLPPISTKTSVLQIYLSILMILGTVTTLLSIWVLTLYNKDETQRIHFLLQKFADYVIAPITCLPCRKKNTVADLTSSDIKLQDTVVRNDDKENIMKNHERSQRIPSSTKNVLGAEQADRMSCREFAIVLDIFLFRVSAFSLFLLTLTITIFLVT